MSTFVVSEAVRKSLRPRRSIPGSAIAPTEAAAKRMLAKIAKPYHKERFYDDKSHAKIYEAGTKAKIERELAPLRKAAHALLLDPTLETMRAADLDTLAAAETMLRRVDRDLSLTAAIVIARGLPDAVRVMVRSASFKLGSEGGYTTSVFVMTAEEDGGHWGDPWPELRHAVCAASEEEYRRARDVARSLRDESSLSRKASIACVFPDEPWANEDLRAHVSEETKKGGHILSLLSAATDPDVIASFVAKAGATVVSGYAANLVHVLPWKNALALFSEALPLLLVKPKYGPLLKSPPREVVQAIACIRRKEAAELLAPHAGNAILGPMVLAFFHDAPELGAALESQAKGKTKLADAVDRVLGKKQTNDARAKIGKASEMPAILRETPWRERKGSARKPTVLEDFELLGLELAFVDMKSKPGSFVPYDDAPVRDMSKKELAEWRKKVEKDEYAHCDFEHERISKNSNEWEYLRIPEAEGLRAWNEKDAYLHAGPTRFIARHGLRALPGFLKRKWIHWLQYEESSSDSMLPAAMKLVSPAMAPSMARVAARRKRYRRVALAWLLEHAEIACYGLVKDAVGAQGEARDDAEQGLLFLATKGKGDLVRKVSKKYGKAVDAAIAELLSRDPLAIDAHVPKQPPFLRVAELPRVKLRSKRALTDECQAALVEMLQITPFDPPYPGIALVRDACDAESLSAFAIELAEQWVLGDAPGRHEWMLFANVHLPSDAGTRRIASLAREWARKDQKKAERAAVALSAISTDFALLHLSHIADTTRFDALRKTTASLVLEAAEARGLTADELGDRTVPDLGLDENGTITLSYGSRSFEIGFDETLSPVVREKSGARLPTLPRPSKTDDANAAKEARVRFDALKSDLKSVADRQRRRLERAMVDGRCWSPDDFFERMAKHPLIMHLARRLVWEASSRTFRVAEDGSLADEKDRATKLDRKAQVRIAHPARDASFVKKWLPVFSDYAILQPFEQLGRTTFTPTSAEAKAKKLVRTSGVVAKGTKVLGMLEARGWRRDDAGHVSSYLRDVRSNDGKALVARLPISPGISMEDIAHGPDQTTDAVVVEREGEAVAIGELDAVGFSEIVRDVEALRTTSK